MPRFKKGIIYEIQYRMPQPDICLPEGFDLTEYVEISVVGDAWASFLNINTGETISCKDFFDKAQEQIRALDKEGW